MKCESCDGRGIIEQEVSCPVCNGTGKTKSFDPKLTEELSSDQIQMFMKGICGVCRGTGVQKRTELCKTCGGSGKSGKCRICGTPVRGNYDLCQGCSKKPHAYLLKNSCGIEDLRLNRNYVGTVSAVTDIGIFVNLNRRLKGLIHRKYATDGYSEGDEITVRVSGIRSSGDIDLLPIELQDYAVIEVSKSAPEVKIKDVDSYNGKLVEIRGIVTHIRLTGGPTIFSILDETGMCKGVAFEGGERAFPEIDVDDVVKISGIIRRRGSNFEVEILDMERLLGEEATNIARKIEREIEIKSEPEFRGFLIESDVLNRLKDEMMKVAKELRRAVFQSRPIIIRHHWDADGICGGVALETALIDLVEKTGSDPDARYFLIRRKVSRAPFYELEDVVKDLDDSLEDMVRHGDKIPLVVLVDNGSGYEDIPAIRQFITFGADIITIDHHYPDDEVDNYLLYHVNPYKAGGDSNYTSGILCTEIARMISDVDLRNLAATSIVGDRAEGEVERYLGLSDYTREELQDIAISLEYEAFYLRFRNGNQIIREILGFGRIDRQKKLVSMLSGYAKKSIEEQLRTVEGGYKVQELPNGVHLIALDIENYSRRFTFPPPGKLTGELHDRMKKKYPRLVTIGYGPDFAVIRSEGVSLDIPGIVRELQNELENAGVEGGGHLVVGSIKFIPARRKDVLSRLAAKIGSLP
jgi:RecJ-like exonuclease